MLILRLFSLLSAILLLGGCASTSGYHNPKDPFEPFNRSMYKFNDALDKAVLKPAAKGYTAVVPPPGRTMVNNFFSNLDDVVVTLNDVLQFKLVQALSDGGRFLINTTLGAGGIADAATKFGFPKHNEDFGQTLGYWGIESGPYLVIPFFGPSSVRDGVGLYTDSITSPTSNIKPVSNRNQTIIFNGVRVRANLLENEKLLEEAGLDPYSFMRDAYLSHRQSLVYDGHPPRPNYEDDEGDDTPPPPSKPQAAPVSTPAPVPAPVSAPVAASAVPAAGPEGK
jgi:phospholipid-binding lipoprotein MlaA